MITPAQCRAARGLLSWNQQDLANEAGVGIVTGTNSRPWRASLDVPRLSLYGALSRTPASNSSMKTGVARACDCGSDRQTSHESEPFTGSYILPGGALVRLPRSLAPLRKQEATIRRQRRPEILVAALALDSRIRTCPARDATNAVMRAVLQACRVLNVHTAVFVDTRSWPTLVSPDCSRLSRRWRVTIATRACGVHPLTIPLDFAARLVNEL
jgi:hypothetical protein